MSLLRPAAAAAAMCWQRFCWGDTGCQSGHALNGASEGPYFFASSSFPILTAIEYGARKMGWSSGTIVRLAAGKRVDESLRQGAEARQAETE